MWNSLHNDLRLQSHTRNSEGCSRAGMAFYVDALCVVLSFILLCFAALLCSFCVKFNLSSYPFCTIVLFPLVSWVRCDD